MYESQKAHINAPYWINKVRIICTDQIASDGICYPEPKNPITYIVRLISLMLRRQPLDSSINSPVRGPKLSCRVPQLEGMATMSGSFFLYINNHTKVLFRSTMKINSKIDGHVEAIYQSFGFSLLPYIPTLVQLFCVQPTTNVAYLFSFF
jgi:hypothetical protein